MSSLLETDRPDDYLSRVARSGVGRAYKAVALEHLRVQPGSRVLDLGCGPGADLAALARAVGPDGRVVGVDSDPHAVAQAKAAMADTPQVDVLHGDIQNLPLPSGSADRAHTDRVLQHVPHTEAVLAEVARVLRPGGLAAFVEPDWDTLVIDHPDISIAGAYRAFITEAVIRNARIGRQLPELCRRSGLGVAGVVPLTAVYTVTQEADQVFGFHRVTRRAVAAGYLTEQQASAWLEHLGRPDCFVSMTLFLTVAEAR